jgi:hypothetical protein
MIWIGIGIAALCALFFLASRAQTNHLKAMGARSAPRP